MVPVGTAIPRPAAVLSLRPLPVTRITILAAGENSAFILRKPAKAAAPAGSLTRPVVRDNWAWAAMISSSLTVITRP